MAVTSGMFLFEVVIEKVNSLVDSRALVIKSDFADIFSLELKDPKQMHIVMPEPPPLPPDPPGKKKKAKPKPKKGKKGKVEAPPPEPVIQSGQSVLFTSTSQFLLQTMKLFPMELSLWNKEDNLTFIGISRIDWDPLFIKYLEVVSDGLIVPPPVTLTEEYNVFEEGTAKLMAKIGLQIKLTFLTDKVTTAFRTLSEDPAVKKYLYTGINSKTTSFICTMKTSDEIFIENSNKVENNFVKDKPKSDKINYADYKNAPAANLTFFNEGDYCCMGNADKPPESIYRSPEKCPDVDFIVDYVRKIIVSCNDNMRMLTPRPTISPRVKATDIDRLCYCRETKWPEGALANRFKDTVQKSPCPVCINAGKRPEGSRAATFDIANIRGPCGRPDCRIARDLRAYIENLVEEDDKEFDLNTLMGPCGSKTCTLAKMIQDFIRHEGAFTHENTQEGLSTQCGCLDRMRKALTEKDSCSSVCSKDCQEGDSEGEKCAGKTCPFPTGNQVYSVFYFTVEHDFENDSPSNPESDKFKYCAKECPSAKDSVNTSCSKTACSSGTGKIPEEPDDSVCAMVCPGKKTVPPSPADSDIVIHFDNIHNPCCVKSCDIAETVKDFIVDSLMSKRKKTGDEDPCYCDCTCTFKFSNKTTYCAVCGGYECLGEDMKDQPAYATPHPCPIYHKLYDKNKIKTPNPFPNEEKEKAKQDAASSVKTGGSKAGATPTDKKMPSSRSMKSLSDRKSERRKSVAEEKKAKEKPEKKKVGKFTANVDESAQALAEKVEKKKSEQKYPYPPVPKNMGWNWNADDIPGMKVAQGWRPGAVSKGLLRKLKQAKLQISAAPHQTRSKKLKKRPEVTKPGLIISKVNGEYRIEMQVTPENAEATPNDSQAYSPLVYKIAPPNNQERLFKRERKKRRLVQEAVGSWPDPFHPEYCERTCLRAYNQAVGILPYEPNNPACTCEKPKEEHDDVCSCCDGDDDDDLSTDCSSLDLNWEIHFTPPNLCKFRPMWKPGASNKYVVRLLKTAKNPEEALAKKRRREQKPKRPLKRPLLIVHKKDGEYTVTMETMKTYNKPRAINQHPYEDKPVLTYTIGRTEAENIDRQKKKEREQRRLERMQRNFIQSAFRDLCQEICLRTYQQALGILPTTESPDCPCFPAHPDATQANIDVSCSCSEAESREASDTDSDEWIVEFTPPSALFDPKFKTKKIVKVDNSSQYTYLDYRVKLFDKHGNPVPRFFKGQDGKQQCSDLGGFWSPEHKWLEINVDGFIAPDGRWAPNIFIGPNGDSIEAEDGKFLAPNGKLLAIGIDGYIDAQNKWRAYPRSRAPTKEKKKVRNVKDKGAAGDKKAQPVSNKPSSVFSCFGDVSPRYLSELGIMGHGPDKKHLLGALKTLIAQGENVKIPERPLVPQLAPKRGRKIQIRAPNVYDARNLQCQHPTPSSKGVLAVNSAGDKVYFKVKDPKNRRPKQRLEDLSKRGISLSSFHMPCFHSFINGEMIKKQQRERMLASNPQNKSVATDAYPANVVYPGNLRPTT